MKLSVIFDIINKASLPIKTIKEDYKGLDEVVAKVQGGLWKFNVTSDIFQPMGISLTAIKKDYQKLEEGITLVQKKLDKFNQTAELFKKMGTAVEQISAPYREFEQGLADLSAMTGIAGKDLESLGKQAREIGVQSGLGATGAVEAFKSLASQVQVDKVGIEGLKILQKETVTLAQVSGISMTAAASSLTGTINQFGLQASEANRVINVLAAGSKYGATEIPELAESLKVVGSTANAAGLTIESTAGALAVLSKNNLKGAEAGKVLQDIMLKMQTDMGVDFNKTSLTEALSTLTPQYKDAAYMAKLFGDENAATAQLLVGNAKEVEKMTALVTGTNVATEQADTKTGTWNHRMKIQAAQFNEWSMKVTETIPGVMNLMQITSHGIGLLAPLTSLGSDAINALKSGVQGVGSTAKGVMALPKTFSLLNQSLKSGNHQTYTALIERYGIVGRLAAAGLWVKNAAISAGNFIVGMFNTQTRTATLLQIKESITTKLSAIWTGVLNGVRSVGTGIMNLWNKRTLVTMAIQKGLSLVLMAGKFVLTGGFIPAMMGAISSTWAWTAALLANPITWIVLGIGALIAAILICWDKFAGFRAVILTIWDAVYGFGAALLQFIIAPFKVIWELVSGLAGVIGKLFSGDFKGAWGEIKEAGAGMFESFSKPVEMTVSTAEGIKGTYDNRLLQETDKQKKKEEQANRKDQVQKRKTTNAPNVVDAQLTPSWGRTSMMESPILKREKPEQIAAYPGDFPTGMLPDAELLATPKKGASADNLNSLVEPDLLNTPGHFTSATNQNIGGGAATMTVNYNPQITISQDVSEKGKQDILAILKLHADLIARLVKEEFRKEERGAYGLS